jgi:hypothetical protein
MFGMRVTQRRVLASLVTAFALLGGSEASGAADGPIAVGEISQPPSSFGIDAAGLRNAAEVEIRQMDASLLRNRRRVVVSIALTKSAVDPIVCTVNAAVRDARTGAMLVIIEADARYEGPVSTEMRKQVANAAVRRAVRRIPPMLRTK